MARKVFFSFHYDDVVSFRANVVRQHGFFKGNQEAGFWDNSIWEEAKKTGDTALKRMINVRPCHRHCYVPNPSGRPK